MKKCALYRCKQCFATMTDEGDVRINKDIVDWMLENEMEERKIGFIAKFSISDKVLIHRCANNTIGVCELIGWRKNRMNFYCTTEHCFMSGMLFHKGVVRCTAHNCKDRTEPYCGSCKWYAEPEGVCVNDQSEHVADFVWDERGCKEWEKKEDSRGENQETQA